MATADETVKFAEKFEGYNYNRMVSEGMRSGNPGLWCADFVAFVMKKNNVKNDLNSSSQQFKSLSGYHKRKDYTPKKGDVFVVTYGKNGPSTGHTGIVTSVNRGSKNWTVSTIEGNKNNKVSRGSYKSGGQNNIVGFWEPPYKKSSSTEKSESNSDFELKSTVIKSSVGSSGAAKRYVYINDRTAYKYELFIQKGIKVYQPSTLDGITLELEEWGTPGKLTFTVLKDNIINFSEGSTVILRVNGKGVFYGYVFTKSRSDHDKINVTAYDQLRYFKNSDTYVYKNKKASDVLKMVASDYRLQTGEISDTGFVIASRIEDNKTLFDIMKEALDITEKNTGKKYILYDNFGYISLVNIDRMKTNLLLNDESLSFDYSSSIDSAYNKIQIYSDNKDTNIREKYIYQNGANISAWGILQKTEKIEEDSSAKIQGETLLAEYNKVTRTLSVVTFGNIYVRPGSSVFVSLNLGDIIQNEYMTVTKSVHTFNDNDYSMNLTLKGGLING